MKATLRMGRAPGAGWLLVGLLGLAALGCDNPEKERAESRPAPAMSAAAAPPARLARPDQAVHASTWAGAAAAPALQPAVAAPAAPAPRPAAAPPAAPARRAPAEVASAAGGDGDLCATVCARSGPLHCPGVSDCQARCQEMRALPRCRGEMSAALHCFASVPLSRWECTDDGLPSVKAGACEPQQAAVAACLSAPAR
jgi:hypothetical protein